MSSALNLKSAIQQVNSRKNIPAVSLVRRNPELAAAISKLVRPRETPQFDSTKRDAYFNLNQGQIKAISDSIISRTKDSENVMQLFPDIELAIQILSSSILSPKDMVKTDLIYKAKETLFASDLVMKLNAITSTTFEKQYKIKDELQELLRSALFTTGSYIKVVLPENVVDEIINNDHSIATESANLAIKQIFPSRDKVASLGILGNPGESRQKSVSLESMFEYKAETYSPHMLINDGGVSISTENYYEVTDNFNVLKFPRLLEHAKKKKVRGILRQAAGSLSTESRSETPGQTNVKLKPQEISALVYKQKQGASEPFISVPTRGNMRRKSIGRPLVLRVPSECFIPVHVPGDPSNRIGGFALIDFEGNFLSQHSMMHGGDSLTSLMNNQNKAEGLGSALLTKARKNLSGDSTQITLDQIMKVYSNIVENDLMSRLSNGLYDSNLEIGGNQEIYRIMLARALESKFTRLLYIPNELFTYFAFRYFDNGVGKSYLDDLKVLTSLRAMLLFSKIMAQTKNSIAITEVNMTLHPDDPDPMKTIEMASHDIIKTRQQYFPLGTSNPVDLMDWITRAGFQFSFEGHPGLPQTKFAFENKNMQHTVPDNELDEMLRKQTYMAFGLSPETMDNGFSAEFATTVVSNNILFSKRVIQLQYILAMLLTDYCQKIMTNDSHVTEEYREVIKENMGLLEKNMTEEEKVLSKENPEQYIEDVIERYIENIEIDLPKPDITSLRTQTEAFDEYVESIDKTLSVVIDAVFLTSELVGEASTYIEAVKEAYKAHFIRQWMSDNGFMTELNDITTLNEDGNLSIDLSSESSEHMEEVVKSVVKLVDKLRTIKAAANKDIDRFQNGTSEDETPQVQPTEQSGGDPGEEGGTDAPPEGSENEKDAAPVGPDPNAFDNLG